MNLSCASWHPRNRVLPEIWAAIVSPPPESKIGLGREVSFSLAGQAVRGKIKSVFKGRTFCARIARPLEALITLKKISEKEKNSAGIIHPGCNKEVSREEAVSAKVRKLS